MMNRSDSVRKGEIYYADLSPVVGSEQGGLRPVIVVQNNVGNKYSPTVIVAAMTSQPAKAKLPTHITLDGETYGLAKDTMIMLEQVRTLDKQRLRDKIAYLGDDKMNEIDNAIMISFGIAYPFAAG